MSVNALRSTAPVIQRLQHTSQNRRMKSSLKNLISRLPGSCLLWKEIYTNRAFHIIGSGSSQKGLVVRENSVPVFCNSATSYIKEFGEREYMAVISDNMLMTDIELSQLEGVRQKPIDHLRHKNREFSNLSPKILILLSSNIYVKSRLELHRRLRERRITPQKLIVFSRLEIFLIEKFFIMKKVLSVGFTQGARFLSYKAKSSTGVRSILIFRFLRKSIFTTGIAEMTESITIGNNKYTSNIFLSHTDIDKFIVHK